MGDNTEDADSRKHYSRRIRTPKKFFDIEASDDVQTTKDSSQTPKEKSRKNKSNKKKTESNGLVATPKSSKKKTPKQTKKSVVDDKEKRDESVKLQEDSKVAKNAPDIVDNHEEDELTITVDIVETVPVKRRPAGRQNNGNGKAKENPPKKCLNLVEDNLERLAADADEVRKVKDMVEALRNRQGYSGTLNLVKQKAEATDEVKNKLGSKVTKVTETKEKELTSAAAINRKDDAESKSGIQLHEKESNKKDEIYFENNSNNERVNHQKLVEDKVVAKEKDNLDKSVSSMTANKDDSVTQSESEEKNDSSYLKTSGAVEISTQDNSVTPSTSTKKKKYDKSVTLETSTADDFVTPSRSAKKKKEDDLDRSVSIETPETNDSVTPSRSSRKKKGDDLDTSVDTETSKTGGTVTPSRSGRKKKGDDLDTSVDTETSTTVDTVTPSRSGRKKKGEVRDNSVTTETVQQESSMALSRSGRKRKVVNYSALENNDGDDDGKAEAEAEETPKKKRARKPKNVEPVENQDDGMLIP